MFSSETLPGVYPRPVYQSHEPAIAVVVRRKNGGWEQAKTRRSSRKCFLVTSIALVSMTVNPGDFLSSCPQSPCQPPILVSILAPFFRGTGGRLLGGNSLVLVCGVSVGRHTWSSSYLITTPGHQAGRR